MTPAERDGVLAAFSLGLGRQALPPVAALAAAPAEARPLAALAMAGQLMRLTTPPPAQAGAGWRLPEDAAPLLPDPARAALLRLFEKADAVTAHYVAPLLLRQIAAAGWRLHPFDLPQLDGVLRGLDDHVGPVERAWLDRHAPPREELTADTWREGGSADRLRFLQARRAADPAAARALLAASFAAETARLRAELLTALDIGLGADDAAFLHACAADRAAGVKQAAGALLAKLPGSSAHIARLAAACAALTVESKGVLRRARLVFRPPAKSATPLQTLDQLGLAELAAALGVDGGALPAMAGDDAVRHALASCALRDGALGVALGLLGRIEEPVWPGDLESFGAAYANLPADVRQDVAARTLRDEAALGGDWRRFGAQLDAPLRRDAAGTLLSLPGWTAFLAGLPAERNLDGTLLPVLALVPPALAPAFSGSLAPIPAVRRPRATALLACLAELAARPHAETAP